MNIHMSPTIKHYRNTHYSVTVHPLLVRGLQGGTPCDIYVFTFMYLYDMYVHRRGEGEFKADRSTIEDVICVVALSLSVVMAGSGHLETFKTLRQLRFVIDENVCVLWCDICCVYDVMYIYDVIHDLFLSVSCVLW